jgi:predicted nucleotidyltransferase
MSAVEIDRLAGRLSRAERTAVNELVAAARAQLGGEIHDVRLFGSRARGDGHADSDIDVAVVVSTAGRARRYEIYDLAFDIGLRHGVNLAPLVIEDAVLADLHRRERRLALDLQREGIPL